ncbi:MAG: hypothetical protein ACREJ3_01325, partial [Polyangiaceae bacterium]
FKRTYAAVDFLPGLSSECTSPTTSFETPTIDFGLASAVQGPLASRLLNWKAPDMGTMPCSTSADCPASAPVCAGTGVINLNGGLASMSTCVAPSALDLQAALRLDGGAYAHILKFLQGVPRTNVAGAMFFLNRAPDANNDCNPPLGGGSIQAPDAGAIADDGGSTFADSGVGADADAMAGDGGQPTSADGGGDGQPPFATSDSGTTGEAGTAVQGPDPGALAAIESEIQAAYSGTPSLRTYFVVLDDDAHDTTQPGGALTFFNRVHADLPQAVTTLDATSTKMSQMAGEAVSASFSNIITQLGTCLYDYGLPAGKGLSDMQIQFGVPGGGQSIV